MRVIITEMQNSGSYREGTKHNVKSLTSAMRLATKNQCFYGTVLTVETENGELLASKSEGKWNRTGL